MDDVFPDYSFIECESPYLDFIKAVYEAPTEEEREFVLSLLVQYVNFIVFSGVYSFDDGLPTNAQVGTPEWDRTVEAWWHEPRSKKELRISDALDAIRYGLGDRVCQDKLWAWLFLIMVNLDSGARAAFTVRVFCPLVTPPIAWDDPGEMVALDRFLQCLHDPARKWAVLEGFTECCSGQAQATIEKFNRWRLSQNQEALEVDYVELEQYLREFGFSKENQEKMDRECRELTGKSVFEAKRDWRKRRELR
jgi:hypothetical protein